MWYTVMLKDDGQVPYATGVRQPARFDTIRTRNRVMVEKKNADFGRRRGHGRTSTLKLGRYEEITRSRIIELISQLYALLLEEPSRWKKRARVLSCCSDDGRIERKNDSHDFRLIVYSTKSINGNPPQNVVHFKCPLRKLGFLVLKKRKVAVG